MTNSKPYVQVASVCERVLQEPDGVITPVRLVDVLTLSAAHLPAGAVPKGLTGVSLVQVMDLAVVVCLKSGDVRGDHAFAINMIDPIGQVVEISAPNPVALKGDDGVNFRMRFGLPLNAPEGLYWFVVLWDGEELTRFPLRLKREAKQAPADSAR